jgi:hypothetical protein
MVFYISRLANRAIDCAKCLVSSALYKAEKIA